MLTPTPNHPLLTTYDHFENGEFVSVYPMLHMPCCNKSVGEQIISQINHKYGDKIILTEFSLDDGGHIAIAFDSTKGKYYDDAVTLVHQIRDLRDGHPESENGLYPEKALLQDRVDMDSLSKDTAAQDHPRYIY